jgi:formylglycine-generating enzyme required for sulfatase activity
MVAIPGGTMPDPEGATRVRPFCLDRARVTGAEFAACTSCPQPGKIRPTCTSWSDAGRARPLNCVSWGEAYDYCKHAGKRLPSKAEWLWLTTLELGDRLRDLSGDVWEWTRDPPISPDEVRFDQKQFMCGGQRGRRGIHQPCFEWLATAQNEDVGFRCAGPP